MGRVEYANLCLLDDTVRLCNNCHEIFPVEDMRTHRSKESVHNHNFALPVAQEMLLCYSCKKKFDSWIREKGGSYGLAPRNHRDYPKELMIRSLPFIPTIPAI